MTKFRVALSADFQKPDGTAAYPSFDLSPLDNEPRIEWAYVPVTNGRVAAEDMVGFDALILLGARFDADSFPGDGRLKLIARFGVGYDTNPDYRSLNEGTQLEANEFEFHDAAPSGR